MHNNTEQNYFYEVHKSLRGCSVRDKELKLSYIPAIGKVNQQYVMGCEKQILHLF